MLIRLLFRLIFHLRGWRFDTNNPLKNHRKSVVIAAPHTSNWDLVYAVAAFDLMNVPIRFTIKKEWLKFPFNLIMKPIGAIPIDRSPKKAGEERKSMVDAMAEIFPHYEDVAIMVTPEGTRKYNDKWRTGFYHVALKAGVPIALGYLDYAKKEAGIAAVIEPTGDYQKDMQLIMDFYSKVTPKYPELFSIDAQFKNDSLKA